jgi:hypothetical protein
MSKNDVVKNKNGREYPLMDIKGKKYLQVAYRLQWLSDDNANYVIDTSFLALTDDRAVAKAVVTILNEQGQMIRRASATKAEDGSSFPDFAEKAETGAVGRALAMLGFGTQHAVSDLDEGTRIVDSPLESKATAKVTTANTTTAKVTKLATKTEVAETTPEVEEKTTSNKPAPFKARLKRSLG